MESVEPTPSAPTAVSIPSPRPRLVIERLTLENFKSYGGEVHVGPFHTSFSSIVGPNGSGKSNVIDAMLFVFGRRAKALRHNKLSELLHNSSTVEKVTSAAVTVYFKEIIDVNSGYEVVEKSEFSVSRRAFRNNTSKYYLNGKEVKMNQVVTVLKGKGVDLDNNRFLILQGEVEQIAMMKPKGVGGGEEGLLEYLEDIIGSGRFVEGIETSGKRVEELNEERGHKLNRVKASERERDALESAKCEAEDYLDKERILTGMKLKACRADKCDREESLKKNGKVLGEKKAAFDEFCKELKGKDKELKDLEKVLKETQRKADISLKTMNTAKDDYSIFERKDIQLREDIKAYKARLKKLETVKKNEKKRVEENNEKVEEYTKEKKEAEEKLKELEGQLGELQENLDKVRDDVLKKTAGTRQTLEEKQTEMLPFSEIVNHARGELEVNQSELKLVVDKLETPGRNLRKAEEALQKMEADAGAAREVLTRLENEEVGLKRQVTDMERHRDAKKEEVLKLASESSALRRRVEEARSRNNDANTRSRLHNGILAASRNGVLHGVVGRLGDLASVEDKYATAVGAAAGSNLDCIVVQTAENAQSCIQFLRREKLGRATFVILEKIEYLRSSMNGWGRSERARDGPRLFDFLRVGKEEHLTCMYYALRDTLVGNSLNDARRMAFKPTRQNRVVTLSGELIESSGAMSGGGRGPSRYKLGSGNGGEGPLDEESFRRLEESFEHTKQQAGDVEKQVYEVEGKIKGCCMRLDELQGLVAKARREWESLQSRISYMRSETLPQLRNCVKECAEKIRRKRCEDTKLKMTLEKTVSVNEKALGEARKACEKLEGDIAGLQERIVKAGGSKLQNAKEGVEKCRAEISEFQNMISKACSRCSAAEKGVKKAEIGWNNAEEQMEKVNGSLEEAKEKSDSMLEDAEKVLEKFRVTEGDYEEWEEKVKDVNKEYLGVKERLKELRREEVGMEEGIQNVKSLVTRDKQEVRMLEKLERGLEKKMKEVTLASVNSPVRGDESEQVDEDEEKVEEEEEEEEEGTDEVRMDVDSRAEDGNEEKEEFERGDFKLSADDRKQLSLEIGALESALSKLSPNVGAISEYQRKDGDYKQQVSELDSLTKERNSARRECDTLRKGRLDEFMSGFSIISLKLKELYQMITLGGDAELELVDSLDPFSEGIVFSVRPPKKSWKNISNLSGGEKTLSSLALVFALHHFKPTPVYFLDEIDAALDFKNVSIVANYVKERTKDAQFIIISLRNNMFELADRLVGIYKTYNTTKSVSVDPAVFTIPASRVARNDDVPV